MSAKTKMALETPIKIVKLSIINKISDYVPSDNDMIMMLKNQCVNNTFLI